MTRRFLTFLLDILPGLILLTALALALWAATGQRLTAYDPASPSTGHGEARTAPEWPRTRGAGSDALTRLPTPPGEPQTDQGTSGVFAVLPGAPDVQDPLPDLSAADRRDSGAAPLGAPPQAAKGGSAAPRLAAIGTSLSAGPTPKVDASSCVTPCSVTVGWLVRQGIASNYGPRYSEWWVALPDGPGWRFSVCGAGGCRNLVSTDSGPSRAMQRAPYNRVVDLPVGAFSDVCGVSWTMGLCQVELTMLGPAR